MSRKIEITILSGVSAGDKFRFDLKSDGQTTLGRAEDCDLVLQDPTVSRRHAKITSDDTGVFLADLGSTHGTTHMGFKLGVGDAERRTLRSGDEFKVGESLFRIEFEEEEQAPVKASEPSPQSTQRRKRPLLANPRIRYALVAGLLGVLILALLPEEKRGLPPQQSGAVLSMPQLRVIGNFSGGKSPQENDHSHVDKAQFALPASDLIVEYEYLTESPIKVFLDQSVIDELQPDVSGWQRRVVVLRDITAGVERRLIFDNLDYPKASGKPKSWAVRDVRATPLARDVNVTFLSAINNAILRADKIRTTADGVFLMLRSMQQAVVEALRELEHDAVTYTIVPYGDTPDPTRVKAQLQSILGDRSRTIPTIPIEEHVKTLLSILSSVDSELWRGVTLGIHMAERSSKQKQYIDTYDTLTGIQKMFPGDEDRRWGLAEEMLSDKKIMPPKIRQNPNKYRKRE